MDTAASVSNDVSESSTSQGYAIPINKALSIAGLIAGGHGSSTIHVGGTAFLGVEVTDDTYGGSGAVITSVVPNSPAAAAGLTAGDVITSFGGQSVASSTGLTSLIMTQSAGTSTSATYVDQNGSTQTANVTLGSGPPR
jgi:S1-C subfamily serine protease